MFLKLEGSLFFDLELKIWRADLPVLRLSAYGETKSEAIAKVNWHLCTGNKTLRVECSEGQFTLSSSESTELLPVLLSYLRHLSGQTMRDVSEKLGSTSPSAYSRYESGQMMPKLDQLGKLVDAVHPGLELILRHASSCLHSRK